MFFVYAEALYGIDFETFNMHLHLNFHDILRDYGPCSGYWLFSFERYKVIFPQANDPLKFSY